MRVRVSVPATAANLGPGFDCLGMALGLYHRISVREEEGEGVEIRATGEGHEELPSGADNMIHRALRTACSHFDYRPLKLIVESDNEIPLAAGLGSSAAAYTAGLAAGVLLSGHRLDTELLIRWGSEQEGHADNVTPCVLGGLAVITNDGAVRHVRIDPPAGMAVQIAIPDFTLPTEEARTVLPETVTHRDAVFNQSRVGLLTAALSTGRMDLLETAMRDRLHQPYRECLVPGLPEVVSAAVAAGAAGAALSGAGPTVLALVPGGLSIRVGRSMVETWKRHGIKARGMTLAMDRRGLVADRGSD